MTDPAARAADPAPDTAVARGLLAQMDEAATTREHWKILITSGMGFFTDAYDLFTVTLLPEPKGTSLEEFTEWRSPDSAVALALADSRGTRPPSA